MTRTQLLNRIYLAYTSLFIISFMLTDYSLFIALIVSMSMLNMIPGTFRTYAIKHKVSSFQARYVYLKFVKNIFKVNFLLMIPSTLQLYFLSYKNDPNIEYIWLYPLLSSILNLMFYFVKYLGIKQLMDLEI